MGNARRTKRRAAAEAEKVANAAALAAARERRRIICGESLDCLRSAHEAAQALARAREAAEVDPHDR